VGKLNMHEPERIFLPLGRRSGTKTPDRIVVASEGVNTERQYFEKLAAKNSRISFKFLSRAKKDKGKSAPEHVLQQLRDFEKVEAPRKYDELWMVIDVDQWENLGEIIKCCEVERYHAAVSNPCFELWLLLHIRPLEEYSLEERQRLLENEKVTKSRTRLDKELTKLLLHGYSKNNPRMARFIPFVKVAIKRARQLDENPDDPWPKTLGTRVYLLAKRILHHKLTDV
jgi:RloB-like protein